MGDDIWCDDQHQQPSRRQRENVKKVGKVLAEAFSWRDT